MPSEARPGFGYSDEISDTGDLLELLARRPAWHADAACKEAPREVSWFPNHGETGEAAKAICAGCLVIGECRAWALSQNRLAGAWGGLSQVERRNGGTRPGRRTVASCTRCADGPICDTCRQRSSRRRLTDAELYPATVALLVRLG
jgi:WhiB family redox-sensing transcriptional regulator